MKNNWWNDLAEELQDAADRKDSKCFYDNLKEAYGPRDVHSAPIRSKDGATLYTNQSDILQRWAEHFNSMLNQQSSFDHTVPNEIPQWPVSELSRTTISKRGSASHQTTLKWESSRCQLSSSTGVQAWWDSTDTLNC